jgi:hypothetical protein
VHRFKKSSGLTASERYLAALCERSFLSLWSYPNVYREPGKELCDNLVVFDNHMIIFSDKSCEFPNTGNVARDWRRWYTKSVQRSAEQVYGAERWLRKHPDRLFIDAKCSQPFPLSLPPPETARFHRVVVALNAAVRCKAFFNNTGTGSLVIRPDIVGAAHLANPFAIGQIDPTKGYVHVLDDTTLDLILGELDTVTDFTGYLTRKEAVVGSGRLGGATGEEELLAHYLTELNNEGVHDIIVPNDVDAAWFMAGSWNSVATNPQYLRKKEADRESYAWDKLIEAFTKHITAGTLAAGNDRPLSDHELGVRVMASASRLERRGFARAIVDLVRRAPRDKDYSTRLVLSEQRPDRAFMFLVSPNRAGLSYEIYRERRAAMLSAYCYVAKLKSPQLLDIVGVATEPAGSAFSSEDLVYLNVRGWTEQDEAQARQLQAQAGILVNPRKIGFHDTEYPEIPVPSLAAHKGNRKQRRAAQARDRKEKKTRLSPKHVR